MFSKVPENRMRVVRAGLALGWIVLIASLFWDPLSLDLTRADNLASPFHIKSTPVMVQGQPVEQVPYHMGARVFWGMIVPLLPLFFMVAGHEAWRRICPLSFLSQLPRYLGWQRRRPVLIRRTGLVERQLALINRDGWLKRNVWYVQFGFLFLALNARILFIDSDRILLAAFCIGVIIAALVVGLLWGGKTWCNYVCPVAIVQKIYTEPRGLFESQPHLTREPISQSMCRTTAPEGERSICVACTANCPDIDLERSYWEGIEAPALRHVYYGFLGLVLGFFSYYYLYAGNWDYYFSGIVNRESDQLSSLFAPGFYIAGHAIAIPKLLAAPLALSLFVGLAILLGHLAEKLYRSYLRARSSVLTEPEIINRCLSFSAFVTINCFYVFAGRSTINLLPPAGVFLFDFLLVTLSTLWFWRATQRSPTQYRRENLASSLMEQLRKLKVDITKYVDNGNLEQLSPNEIYVLAKTLPGFDSEQRLQAYRNILDNALRTGRTDPQDSTERLREMRTELGVTDEEHRQLLEDIGIDNTSPGSGREQFVSYENWLRSDNYRKSIEAAITTEMEKGTPLSQIMARAEITQLVTESRELYQIDLDEHHAVVVAITGQGGAAFARARRQLEFLRDNAAIRFALQNQGRSGAQWESLTATLDAVLQRRSFLLAQRLFSFIRTMGNTAESRWVAHSQYKLMGEEIEAVLQSPMNADSMRPFIDMLDPEIVLMLRSGLPEADGPTDGIPALIGFHEVVASEVTLETHILQLVADEDKVLSALALTALSFLDLERARTVATDLHLERSNPVNWLLAETCDNILGIVRPQSAEAHPGLTLTRIASNGARTVELSIKDHLTVGRAADNDIVLLDPALSHHHLSIDRDANAVWVRSLDRFAPLLIDGQACGAERAPLQNGGVISFAAANGQGPSLMVEWHAQSDDYQREQFDNISKVLWFSGLNLFRSLDLATVAELAKVAEVRAYAPGTWLCHAGQDAQDAYLIQQGSAEVVREQDGEVVLLTTLGAGAIVGELGVITGGTRAASVRVGNDAARIVTINGERLRSLMRQYPQVSMPMLSIVAGYVKR